MKIEPRGKYGGVKVHLDSEECERLIDVPTVSFTLPFVQSLGSKIKHLMQEEPDLLMDRTQEQIAAILAKESEKAQLQLNQIKSGSQWQQVDAGKLKLALLKHAK